MRGSRRRVIRGVKTGFVAKNAERSERLATVPDNPQPLRMNPLRTVVFVLTAVIGVAGLFLRSYTLPPAPDRRGGTTLMLAAPNRPLFGSPRGDCLGTLPDVPVIVCLVGSVTRAREAGLARLELPFCAACYALSQRIAALGLDAAAVKAKQEQFARFGW